MVAGSHHCPESFIIYIKNRENIKKILAINEDRTPTERKNVCRTIDVTAQPNQISIFSRLFIHI